MATKSKRAKLNDAAGGRLTGTRIALLLSKPTRTVQEWLSGGAKFPIERLVDLASMVDIGDRGFRDWAVELARARKASKSKVNDS